ncbi:MAG: hypothetical protein ACT4QF_18810 [Sporichthyaceae bacterium]|jgi:hypothetical protein
MRRTAPYLAAAALLGSLWVGVGPAAASSALPASSAVAASAQHWDDDDHDDDYGHRGHRGRYGNDGYYYGDPDEDLEDYPYCDRRGNGYGCPEYGYPPGR